MSHKQENMGKSFILMGVSSTGKTRRNRGGSSFRNKVN